MKFHLTIMGCPVPKQSARFASRGGRMMSYQPDDVTRYEKLVAGLARVEWEGKEPLDGPLHLDLVAWMPRPASVPVSRLEPCTKPDLDNLLKPIMDAIQQAKVIVNDSRVVSMSLRKRYEDTEGTRVEVAVSEL